MESKIIIQAGKNGNVDKSRYNTTFDKDLFFKYNYMDLRVI